MINRETREKLNALSKQVFGSSSRWQKLMNRGTYEQYTRDREVMVPRANGSVGKKVFTDKKYVAKLYTVEEVEKLMTDILNSRTIQEVKAPELVSEIQVDVKE